MLRGLILHDFLGFLSMSDINKVVLAYSGGLDTSVIVRWLQETYQCEVVTFTADLGQGEDCLLYTSPSPRDRQKSRMPSSA